MTRMEPMSTRRVRRSASDAVGRSWHGPPQAALPEASGQPLQRPAQLLPAAGLRLEGRQLPAGRVRQPIEDEPDGSHPRLLHLSQPARTGRLLQAADAAGARSSPAPGRAPGRPAPRRSAGASSSCRRRAARPGARWRAAQRVAQLGAGAAQGQRNGAHSRPAAGRRRCGGPAAPDVAAGRAAADRRHGPAAAAARRGPRTGRRPRSVAAWPAVPWRSARTARSAGAWPDRRGAGRAAAPAELPRARARKAAGASGRSGRASRAASTASQRFSPAPTRTASGATPRASATARAAMRRSVAEQRPEAGDVDQRHPHRPPPRSAGRGRRGDRASARRARDPPPAGAGPARPGPAAGVTRPPPAATARERCVRRAPPPGAPLLRAAARPSAGPRRSTGRAPRGRRPAPSAGA